MSMNISTSGGNGIPERPVTRQQDPIVSEGKNNSANSASSIRTASAIHSIEELQRAELRGEHYTVSQEQMVKAMEQAMKAVQGKAISLDFSVHEETQRITVKVMDKETGDIIREVPPEKSLDYIYKLWELAGLLVDERR